MTNEAKKQRQVNTLHTNVGEHSFAVTCHLHDKDSESFRAKAISTQASTLAFAKGLAAIDPSFVEFQTKSSNISCTLHFAEADAKHSEAVKALRSTIDAIIEEQTKRGNNIPRHADTADDVAALQQFYKDGVQRVRAAKRTHFLSLIQFELNLKNAITANPPVYKTQVLSNVPELLPMILSFLDFSALAKCTSVCKYWYSLVATPSVNQEHAPIFPLLYMEKHECAPRDKNEYVQRQKMEQESSQMLGLIARMGHLIGYLPDGACADGEFINVYEFLPNLQELKGDFSTPNIEFIAQHCKNIKKLIMENPFEVVFDSMFVNCKDLEEIQITSDECDISVDGVTSKSLELLAANTSGNLREINLNACTQEVSHEALAKVIKKSPKLDSLVFVYEMYNLEAMDTPPKHSVAVEALCSHNKKYSRVAMNWLSKKDKEIVASIATVTREQEEEEEE